MFTIRPSRRTYLIPATRNVSYLKHDKAYTELVNKYMLDLIELELPTKHNCQRYKELDIVLEYHKLLHDDKTIRTKDSSIPITAGVIVSIMIPLVTGIAFPFGSAVCLLGAIGVFEFDTRMKTKTYDKFQTVAKNGLLKFDSQPETETYINHKMFLVKSWLSRFTHPTFF